MSGNQGNKLVENSMPIYTLDMDMGQEAAAVHLPARRKDTRPVGRFQQRRTGAVEVMDNHLPVIVDEAQHIVAGDGVAAVGEAEIGVAVLVVAQDICLFGVDFGPGGFCGLIIPGLLLVIPSEQTQEQTFGLGTFLAQSLDDIIVKGDFAVAELIIEFLAGMGLVKAHQGSRPTPAWAAGTVKSAPQPDLRS